MRKYREYTDTQFIEAAKNSKSLAEMLRSLKLKPAGGNYDHAKKTIQRLNIDCSHWTGRLWNKGIRLKDWSDYARGNRTKPHLIKLRGHKCEMCKLENWLNFPIGLEVHHIDGDRTNNSEKNLQLLCGNCHYTTPNFRNRKRV